MTEFNIDFDTDVDIDYIASPYTHPDPDVMQKRFEKVRDFTAKLMELGKVVYSPIVHNHPIAIANNLPRTWDFWGRLDIVIMNRLNGKLIVYMVDGWEESKGVAAEIKFAQGINKPIEYYSEQWIAENL